MSVEHVLPIDTVHEESHALSDAERAPMQACIVGGNARVVRYRDPEDKEAARAGGYTGAEATYLIPHLAVHEILDESSINVYADSVFLRYALLSDSMAVPDMPDRIAIGEYTGDVQLGDSVLIQMGGKSLRTYVLGTEGKGEDRKLLLSRNLPADMRSSALQVSLCIAKSDVELSSTSYKRVESGITIPAGLTMLDKRSHANSVLVPLPVILADIYIEYRAWLPHLADRMYEAADLDSVIKIPGAMDPKNPLKFAVRLAKLNAGSAAVRFVAVANPDDTDSWAAAFGRVGREYGIVPLTLSESVLELAEEYVENRSRAESGRECVLWRSLAVGQHAPIAHAGTSLDHKSLYGKVRELPAGGLILEIESGNSQFMKLGVRAGDFVTFGIGSGYDAANFFVTSVLNDDTLAIQGTRTAGDDAVRTVEVWRKLNKEDLAHAVGAVAARCNDKRIRLVWPDRAGDDSHIFPGFFLCAALAGLRSGCATHQDLTGVEIAGITQVPRTVTLFDNLQLDMMAELGVWIVTLVNGIAVTRNAITTVQSQNPELSDESVVSTVDWLNKALREEIAQVLHTVRASSAMRQILQSTLTSRLHQSMVPVVTRLGPQLIDGEVLLVRRHVLLEDNIVLNTRYAIPLTPRRGFISGSVEVLQKIVA